MSVSTMKKLIVFSSEKDTDAILRRLMGLRCVEISRTDCSREDWRLQRWKSDLPSEGTAEKISAVQKNIADLTPYTSRRKKLGRHLHKVDREAFLTEGRAEAAWRTVDDCAVLRDRIAELEEKKKNALRLAESLSPWMGSDILLNELSTDAATVMLGVFPAATTVSSVVDAVADHDAFAECIAEDKNGLYVAVTCHKQSEEALNATLASRGFVRVTFASDVEGTAEECYIRCMRESEQTEEEILRTRERFVLLAEQLNEVEILYDLLETDRLLRMQKQKLAQSSACTVLEGWIPTFTQDAVEEVLDKFPCAYEIDEPSEKEEPPVLLRNNRFSMNFEWVIGMYAYPKYGRFDPTFIMSIFYFLIFGMMFADVGYGLILMLACFGGVYLLKPKPGLRRMMYMFGYCGISCVAQGILFGGWFGDLPTAIMTNVLHVSVDTSVGHFFGSGLWFNPLDDPMTFLILSLAVGGVHLVAGMAVKFYILCKDGKTGEAICTIVPFWVLFAGVVLLFLLPSVGTYVAIAGVALILALNGYGQRNPFKRIMGGLGGLYGLINYVSDLLSYSRILALGLVAGVIAKVINLITMMGGSGVLGFIVMLLVLIIGHLLNLVINVLGTFVHTSRLQYIEFFGKFYEDGGRPFEAALPSEEYSEEIK